MALVVITQGIAMNMIFYVHDTCPLHRRLLHASLNPLYKIVIILIINSLAIYLNCNISILHYLILLAFTNSCCCQQSVIVLYNL